MFFFLPLQSFGGAPSKQSPQIKVLKDRPAKRDELPHVKGIKSSLVTRGQQGGSPKTNEAQRKEPSKRMPIYAEEEVCRQFAIEPAVRPSDNELDDIVMYGELAQARPQSTNIS